MSGDQRNHQCLIFVVHEGRLEDFKYPINASHQLKASGFALLSQDLKVNLPNVVELFTGKSLKIINNDEMYPDLDNGVKSDRVEIVEVILDENSLTNSNQHPLHPKHLYAERYNDDILQALSDTTSFVQFEAKFHINNIRTSLVDENLKFIEHLLSLRADIRYRHSKGGTILHLAVERGDDILVRLLLAYGANVATVRNDGSTALHLAAQKGHTTIVRSLLDAGAILNAQMKDGSTPLHLSVENGHFSIVRLLLSQGAFVNATALSSSCLGGATPLHIAIEKKNTEMVKFLLANGANINAEAFFGITVLQLAIEQGSCSIVDDVLSYYPDIHNANNKRAFRLAVCRNDEEYNAIVNKLLASGFMVEKEDVGNAELLLGAIRKNSLQLVRKLLDCGTRVNEMLGDGFFAATPLHTAARHSREDMVQLLLDAGADPKGVCGRGRTPVDDAFECVNLKALKVFVANNVHDRNDHQLFLTAANEGWIEIIESLLQTSPAVTLETITDRTLLFTAAQKGHGSLVEFALKYGTPVDIRDSECRTALHEAAEYGFFQVAEILLRNGADVNAKCIRDRTPIFEAARHGQSDVVEVLLKFGARVDIRDSYGRTVLHEAAVRNYNLCLRTLLEYNFTNPKFVSFVYQLDVRHGALELHFRHKLIQMMDVEEARSRRRNDSDFGSLGIFARHAIKTSAADLRFNDKTANPVWKSKELTVADCKAEIEIMKTEILGGSNVSFYDIFRGNNRRIACYARNSSIIKIVNSSEYNKLFPIYGNVIKYQFQKGMLRKELLEPGIKISGVLFDQYVVLPDDVKEKILNYLSDNDLIVLVNAFKNKRTRGKVGKERNIGFFSRLFLQLAKLVPSFIRRHIRS